MSRVLTFSRYFPKNHPKAGEPTYFMQRIWKGLDTGNRRDGEYDIYTNIPRFMKRDKYWRIPVMWRDQMLDDTFLPKYHTIRAGHRWKVGDFFSPRVWSGQPYCTKQLTFGPDIEVKSTWDIEIYKDGRSLFIGKPVPGQKDTWLMLSLCEVAKNDGLDCQEFQDWFKSGKMPFVGQIICWNDKIEY